MHKREVQAVVSGWSGPRPFTHFCFRAARHPAQLPPVHPSTREAQPETRFCSTRTFSLAPRWFFFSSLFLLSLGSARGRGAVTTGDPARHSASEALPHSFAAVRRNGGGCLWRRENRPYFFLLLGFALWLFLTFLGHFGSGGPRTCVYIHVAGFVVHNQGDVNFV